MIKIAEKKKINGGDLLIKCLLQEDVEYMFGIPGGQFLNMYDAIYRWGRELNCVRNFFDFYGTLSTPAENFLVKHGWSYWVNVSAAGTWTTPNP